MNDQMYGHRDEGMYERTEECMYERKMYVCMNVWMDGCMYVRTYRLMDE